jgi:tetratricopeptide (TPR) repeat protein
MRKWLLVTVVALTALALGIWMMSGEPKHAIDLIEEGQSLAREGKFEQAITKYGEAIRREPGLALAYFVRASARMEQQRYDDAVSDLDNAIRLTPDDAWCFALRGEARIKRREILESLSDLNEAIRLDPEIPRAHANRGLIRIEQRDFEAALLDLTHAIEIEPDKFEYLHSRAVIHGNLGDWDNAIRDNQSSLRIKPNHAALAGLASILATCPDAGWRDGKDALEFATEACRITSSKEPLSLLALAESYAELGDFEQAIAHAEHSLNLADDEAKAYHRRRLEQFKAGMPYRRSVPEP